MANLKFKILSGSESLGGVLPADAGMTVSHALDVVNASKNSIVTNNEDTVDLDDSLDELQENEQGYIELVLSSKVKNN